jgi:hypothetical protein
VSVLGLASPVWLLGLTSLLVPLALHLWTRRGGKPIRVGSIRLLLGAPPATRRSWHIQDLWLLLLRGVVLAALVLALAGLHWSPRDGSERRWAVVGADVASRGALLDSLARAGLKTVPDSDIGPGDHPENLWTMLQEIDRIAPGGTRIVAFAPDRLRYFRGVRPTLRSPVEWHPRAPVPDSTAPLPRVAPRSVAIFADPARAEDARYLEAAIEAAAEATRIPALVVTGAAAAVDAAAVGSADWIAWLSSRPLPGVIGERVRRGATLWSDVGGGSPDPHRSRILLVDRPSDAWLLHRSAVGDSGAPLWTDGTGAPLLTVSRLGSGLHYAFHSRLQPVWNTLVMRAAFPEALARLWVGPDSASGLVDERRITLGQLLPETSATRSASFRPREGGTSLFMPLWLVAVVLFGAERWLSRRPRREVA